MFPSLKLLYREKIFTKSSLPVNPSEKANISKNSEYYNHQYLIYQEFWDADGRICWGYYPPEKPEITFEEAGQKHVESMAAMVPFDANSKVLELGCGNSPLVSTGLSSCCHIKYVQSSVYRIEY